MPISNPSEFPPHRAGDQIIGLESGKNHIGARVFLAGQSAGDNSTITDLILIGNLAGSSGLTDTNYAGTIAIGPSALKTISSHSDGFGPNMAIGLNAAENLIFGGDNLVIGANALASSPGVSDGNANHSNVVLGNQAGQAVASTGINALSNAVIIGANACQMTLAGGHGTVSNGVIIGQGTLLECLQGNVNMVASVVIGQGCFPDNTFNSGNGGIIAIGQGINGTSGGTSVYIGGQINATGFDTVAIGVGVSNAGIQNNVIIGDHAKAVDAFNVVLGSFAGNFEATTSNKLIIEVGEFGATITQNQRLIYGDFGGPGTNVGGGLILGNSSHAAGNDVIQGTNSVKIINGTIGGANPIGGGYFYVSAGALHWVGSSGTDTTVAPA